MNHLQECNICDKQVVKLAQHVRQAHDMNMTEYYDNENNKIENSETSEMEQRMSQAQKMSQPLTKMSRLEKNQTLMRLNKHFSSSC